MTRTNAQQIELHDPKLAKDAWDKGPWQNEPDKIQWIDAATNLDCLMTRGPGGHWCGYVGVGPDHPLHGKGYDSIDAVVHGGLTFFGKCSPREDGFGICHVPQNGRTDDVWWLGFDCAHCGDLSPRYHRDFPFEPEIYRNVSYVQDQCARLAEQLAIAATQKDDLA